MECQSGLASRLHYWFAQICWTYDRRKKDLMLKRIIGLMCLAVVTFMVAGCDGSSSSDANNGIKKVQLLNVSYDPTREFYQEFNESFAAHWKATQNEEVYVEQSHGGAGKQARAVMDGLEADVITLALGYDIDVIAERTKLLPTDWQSKFPKNSAPYSSTIVFLVRKGNPKGIKDWGDLEKEGIEIITPNPKTSGGARWNYLAAWGAALAQELGGVDAIGKANPEQRAEADKKARAFIEAIFRKVPVLDSGARGATNSFVQRQLGDVLLTWENEAFLALKESGGDQVEVVVPKLSILAEPPVAVVEEYAKKHGTLEIAKAYLEHLYSPQGQQLAAKHFFRPNSAELISKEQLANFADVELFQLNDIWGSWAEAQKIHFDDGGIFDQIYQPK
jgi:sulfate transport system substrate-binding protein